MKYQRTFTGFTSANQKEFTCVVESDFHLVTQLDAILCRRLTFNIPNILLVTDDNLYPLIGKEIVSILSKSYLVKPLIMPIPLQANFEYVKYIIDHATPGSLFVAVGSGTINDLVKYAAAQLRRPYIVVATAPSMNGYCAANASLVDRGIKKTFTAVPPAAAFFDLDLLMQAPKNMIAAGIADCLCRSTVQADWLLAHLLINTSYDSNIVREQVDVEQTVMPIITKATQQNPKAMLGLVQLIVLSGIAMTNFGSSAPASQGEHMLAHYLETHAKANLRHSLLHGEMIALTCLIMSELQEKILHMPVLHNLNIKDYGINLLQESYLQQYANNYWDVFQIKQTRIQQYPSLAEKLKHQWPYWRQQISAVKMSSDLLLSIFHNLGLPTTAEEIGLSDDDIKRAMFYTRFTRDRFTFLDLADWAGLLTLP